MFNRIEVMKREENLEGRKILHIDTDPLPDTVVVQLKIERMECMADLPSLEGFPEKSLLLYMEEHGVDVTIIHPEIYEEWINQIQEVIDAKKKIILIKGDGRVRKGYDEIFERWKKDGVPIIEKPITSLNTLICPDKNFNKKLFDVLCELFPPE